MNRILCFLLMLALASTAAATAPRKFTTQDMTGCTWSNLTLASPTCTGILTTAATRVGVATTLTAADVNLTAAAIQAASFWPVTLTANAVDVDFGDDAALAAADIGSQKVFHVSTGHATQALTVTAGASGVTTITTLNTLGTTCEDVGDMITCTVYGTTKATCVTVCAD